MYLGMKSPRSIRMMLLEKKKNQETNHSPFVSSHFFRRFISCQMLVARIQSFLRQETNGAGQYELEKKLSDSSSRWSCRSRFLSASEYSVEQKKKKQKFIEGLLVSFLFSFFFYLCITLSFLSSLEWRIILLVVFLLSCADLCR